MLRKDSRAVEADLDPNDSGPVMATLTARASDPPPAKGEEGMHIFWRVFGGALVSLSALVGVTLYNGVQSGIAELRGEIARINEARADGVRYNCENDRNASGKLKQWSGSCSPSRYDDLGRKSYQLRRVLYDTIDTAGSERSAVGVPGQLLAIT